MNLKQTFEKLKARVVSYRGHALAAVTAAGLCSGAIYLQGNVKPGFVSWLACMPALAVILVTVLARLDDIGMELRSRAWQVRRLGLVLVGLGAVQIVLSPFSDRPLYPSWIAVLIAWGIALTWLTTPNMPPWWKHITGADKHTEDQPSDVD